MISTPTPRNLSFKHIFYHIFSSDLLLFGMIFVMLPTFLMIQSIPDLFGVKPSASTEQDLTFSIIFSVLFQIIGVTAIIGDLLSRMKALSLFKNGQTALASITDIKSTRVSINKKTVHKVTYSFKDRYGSPQKATIKQRFFGNSKLAIQTENIIKNMDTKYLLKLGPEEMFSKLFSEMKKDKNLSLILYNEDNPKKIAVTDNQSGLKFLDSGEIVLNPSIGKNVNLIANTILSLGLIGFITYSISIAIT